VSPADTTRILTSLGDKPIENKIESVSVDSRKYWITWKLAYDAVRDELTDLFERVTVKIDARPLKADVKMSKRSISWPFSASQHQVTVPAI
jgi:hypothetical protein